MTQPTDPTNLSTRQFGRRRRGEQKEQLKELILKTASELFIEQGYSAFSMRKLAEKLGYSPATLYIYYHDKDHLLFSVVDDAFTLFRMELAQAASSTNNPWERLNRIGEAYIQFGLTHSIYYQLMFMWRIDYLIQAKQGEETPRLEAFQVLFDSVKYAQNNDAIKAGDPYVYSDMLWAALHGVVALSIQMPMFTPERSAKLVAETKEMLYMALRP
ncbi:TetR/AcrR family transcriptional regulator [Paenibacillus sp. MMS18-CY102]|uniref:TetR/AcrR family transcriptional regulator n=1 Tax=Paenibacillus sp. MMS18-CY102 TaxID=2682849 RepID=UPI0013666E57|nr:TetR/AcrR family transcriptional regulator [Paenibacillus sp. MMS18-CY102]